MTKWVNKMTKWMCIAFSSSPGSIFSFSQAQSQLLSSHLKPAITAFKQGRGLGRYQLCPPWVIQAYRTFPRLLLGCRSQLFAHVLQGSAPARGALCIPQVPLTQHCYAPLKKSVGHGIFPSFPLFLQLASKTLFFLLTALSNLGVFFCCGHFMGRSVVAEGASPSV